jgi:Ca-activated chloride channel family protein
VLGGAAFLASQHSSSDVKAKAQVRQGTTEPEPGQLTIIQKDGKVGDLCPLERTSVVANVSGFGARVGVTQTFHNPAKQTIEAVYTFPLPENAAVDHMTMRIGDRVVEGVIKQREQARRIYEAAKAQGQATALLDQERPNIFTQSVANITPGAQVRIEIQYVQTLKFQNGTYEFNFPMVVGPRFLGNAKDPGKITPPITPKGTRTGANIDLTVNVNAGAPVQSLSSVLHKIDTQRIDPSRYTVRLANQDEIPNRDFILRYQVSTDKVTDVFISHMDPDKGGFFALGLLPPKAPQEQDITAKEMIFVMDQSGSQSGFPIEKSKELTLKLIKTLRPDDTFNVFGFNNTVRSLWPSARPNTPANIKAAEEFVRGMQANGGTQLLQGLEAALRDQRDPKRLRIVVFNTDGFVGDENQILDRIQRSRDKARIFTFGIGNGVNRSLIDAMSSEGRGAAEYVTLAEEADGAVAKFIQRTRTPVLTDVSIKVDGAVVTDVEPSYVPDVFDQSPVYVFGRYQNPGPIKITVTGMHGGKPWSKTISASLPPLAKNPSIMSLWARDRVDSLTRQNYVSSFSPEGKDLEGAITDMALDFGIMTQYTSFVAVESRVVNIGGKQRTIRVPVEMADGVSYEGAADQEGRPIGLGRGSYSAGVQIVAASPALSGGGGIGGGGGGLYRGNPGSKIMRRIPIIAGRTSYTSSDTPKEKIAKKLRSATGKVEVQIWLSALDDKILKALTDQGLKVEAKDEKLRIVFATVDASKLKAIPEIAEVQRIEPLEG